MARARRPCGLDRRSSRLQTEPVRALGKRFGERVQDVAKAVAAADAAQLAADLRAGTALVDVDGERVDLGPDDVVVAETPRSGWAVASAVRRDSRAGPRDCAGAAQEGADTRGGPARSGGR